MSGQRCLVMVGTSAVSTRLRMKEGVAVVVVLSNNVTSQRSEIVNRHLRVSRNANYCWKLPAKASYTDTTGP